MKAVTDREKSFYSLLEASRRWSRSTARTLTRLLAPELAAGETMPDLVLLQELFARALTRRWQRVLAADEARIAARERRRALLAELELRIRALYREVADLRSVLTGVFGAAAARRVIVFAGDTARDPLVLLRQAARLIARLRDRSRTLPPAAFEPTEKHRDRWTAPLAASAKALQATFDAASLAGRELEAVKVELRQALKEYNPLLVGVASWFAGTYHATGRDNRAKAVRPSRRRRGLLLQDASRAGRASAVPSGAVSEAANSAEGHERPLLRFAPLRQALRLLGGRSSEDGPPRSVASGVR